MINRQFGVAIHSVANGLISKVLKSAMYEEASHPFNKGVLLFDDFNYATYFLSQTKKALRNLLGRQLLKEVAKDYNLLPEDNGSINSSKAL